MSLVNSRAKTRTLDQVLQMPCLKRKNRDPLEGLAVDRVFSWNHLDAEVASRDARKDLLESTLVRFSWEKFCSIFNQATKKQQLFVYEASVKLLRFI